MNLISTVYQSIKRKTSNEKEAARIGIPLNQYCTLKEAVLKAINTVTPEIDHRMLSYLEDALVHKKNIDSLSGTFKEQLDQFLTVSATKVSESKVTEINENLEKGTATITGISSTLPRTPEEIISILKIDTTKWKLSQYWNKEKSDKWLVSAMVTAIPMQEQFQNSFLELLETYDIPAIKPVRSSQLNTVDTESVCGVISMQDLHFGKPGNENIGDVMNACVLDLLTKAHKSYYLERLIFVVGADTLNMDTFDGATTKGTLIENSEHSTDTYIKAFDSICAAVSVMKQFCKHLEVVFIPGNHDRLSSFHLLHAVAQAFTKWEDMSFDIAYAERKVFSYGDNMFAFEHGDVTTKNNPLVYAVEFPKQWGAARFRKLYTGHYHTNRTKEYITKNEEHGFVTKILPALTSSDYWHYHNKFVGNTRAGVLELNHPTKGVVAEFTYSAEPL